MDFQRVRASRSFAEHLGSCQEPVDLLGQAEEPQAVARAQDRVGGRMKHRLATRARHGDDPDPQAPANARFAPGLIPEISATEPDLAKPPQPRARGLRAGPPALPAAPRTGDV